MEHADPQSLSAALLQAPGWARIGLTAPTRKIREASAQELVAWLLDHLDSEPIDAQDQLPLPL